MGRIMVVDDDVEVVSLIERTLRRRHVTIGEHDSVEALRRIDDERPDLLILDVALPGMNGASVCETVRSRPLHVAMPILLLTVNSQTPDKVAGFDAAADDYVSKPFDVSELEWRVEALLRRRESSDSSLCYASNQRIKLDLVRGRLWIDGRPIVLSPIEYALFVHLIARAGAVNPARTLLRAVWHYPEGSGSTSLVRMHVLNIRRKIEADPKQPRLLRTIPRHGYTIDP